MAKKVCVIGAGTYGSYIINALLKTQPDTEITLFDVGDAAIKSESEIGFMSQLKASLYKGLTDGRWFGFGGASAKWGGQLLTFTENDFANPDAFMQDVIALDKKHKEAMLAKFKIVNPYPETQLGNGLFTKTGVWLSIFGRNFFNVFKINKQKNVKILTHARVVRLLANQTQQINGVVFLENGNEKTLQFDYYFLTAGAFESARILLDSGMIAEQQVPFSDHLSQKVFKIKKSTKIGPEDFVFRMTGTSLITKRIIGEIDGCSFYAHPVFNMDFPFFESVKLLLFKRQFSWRAIKNIFTDLPNVMGFAWTVLVKRRMYVLNNEWFLYIDIENPTTESFVKLSPEHDSFGVHGLDVHYHIDDKAEEVYNKAKELVMAHLNQHRVEYTLLAEKIDVQTCEDIYHPFGMFPFKSVNDYFNRYPNLLLVNTGILSRSGGINPTAAVLPLVDEFILTRF